MRSQCLFLMMVAVRTMRMAVGLFFRGCVTNAQNLNTEVKGFARKRVIAVDMDFVVFDCFDQKDQTAAVASVGFELHSRLKLHALWELGSIDDELQLRVDFAVTFLRRNSDLLLIADVQTFQSVFQAWNDLLSAMKIRKRLLGVGLRSNNRPP